MGWFSSFCSWVGDKVKKTVNYVKEKAVQAKNWIKDKYNKFTGKDMADKAKRIYEESRKKYDNASSNYKKEVDNYSNEIKKHVESINANKVLIKRTLFVELVKLLECIKEVEISQAFAKEAMNYTAYEPSGLRSQSQIMKIDFDNEPIKNNLKALFTLGFWTRKQARESLDEAEVEAKKVDDEIARMDAELVKIRSMANALSNISIYFDKLVEMYNILLQRVHASIDYLYVRNMTFAGMPIKDKMSIRSLPLAQIKELEAIVTASQIMKVMVETNIMEVKDTSVQTRLLDLDKKLMRDKVKFEEAYKAA